MKSELLAAALALPRQVKLVQDIVDFTNKSRVFERIDPEALENSLGKWLQQLIPSLEQEIVPIDGKCLRGSYDRNQGIKALHLVTAWAAKYCLTLRQIKVEDHSNEITAIPALLELIDIKGAIVTIDAMGTQTEIVRLIREKKVSSQ